MRACVWWQMVQVLDAADKYLQAKPQRRKSTADAVKAGKQAAKLCTQVVVGAVEDVARYAGWYAWVVLVSVLVSVLVPVVSADVGADGRC